MKKIYKASFFLSLLLILGISFFPLIQWLSTSVPQDAIYKSSLANTLGVSLFRLFLLLSIATFVLLLTNLVIYLLKRKSESVRRKISKRLTIITIIFFLSSMLFLLTNKYFIDFLVLIFGAEHSIFDTYGLLGPPPFID